MKEIYESPELNLISFVPAEKLASSFGYDALLQGNGGQGQAPMESTDIGWDF